MAETQATNGSPPIVPELPESRQAAVQAGLAFYQEVAAERDVLVKEVAKLRTEIAAHKAVAEAQSMQISELKSQAMSAYSVRDDMFKEAERYKTVCKNIQAVLRSAEVMNEPVITEREEQPQIGGA